MEYVDTKYLLINDGDVVFKNGGCLEACFKMIEEGYKIVSHKEVSDFPAMHMNKLRERGCKNIEYYSRFVEPVAGRKDRLCCPRVHLMHTFLDLEYFKQIYLLGDDLSPDVLKIMCGGLVDTGSDFYHKLYDRKIPIGWLNHFDVVKYLVHWGWLSSANRDKVNDNENCYRNQIAEMENHLYNQGIQDVARKVGIHPMKLVQSFKKTKGKSGVS